MVYPRMDAPGTYCAFFCWGFQLSLGRDRHEAEYEERDIRNHWDSTFSLGSYRKHRCEEYKRGTDHVLGSKQGDFQNRRLRIFPPWIIRREYANDIWRRKQSF